MKTAIIKTDFWLDDEIFELNSDTRLLYLCLLTNPNRDLLPAFKCSDRLLSAYTGYSRDLIDICRKQLIAAEKIVFIKGYYIFCQQDFVKPSTGRDSLKIYERDWNKLPLEVQDCINQLHEKSTGTSTGSGTGTSTGRIDIDINKDIDIGIDKGIVKKEIPVEATRLASTLQELVMENFDFIKKNPKDVETWAKDIERIHRIDGYDWLIIEAVIRWSQNDDFWKQNIRSGAKLRKKFEDLLIKAKVEHDNKSDRVVTV